jgi:TP901 family phage tail tape measure protein
MAASRKQELRVVISGDSSQLKRAFASAEMSASKFERGMGSSMARVGSAMRHLSVGAFAGAGLGIGALVKAGADYEQQMARVQAVTGATGAQFTGLGNLAKQLGKDTKFSAGQAAEAMYELGSAGFKASEMSKVLPGTLALAAASSVSLADAAEISSNALRGFGLEGSKSKHVADVLATAVAASSVEMQDLQLSLKYIGPVAKLTGQSFEDMIAAVELMGNAGIKGEQAGTTLRGALTRLTKPTKSVEEGLHSLGLRVSDLNGPKGLKPLPDLIRIVAQHSDGMAKSTRNAALAHIFGTEALSGMAVLVDKGAGKLDKLSKANEKSDGAAKKMADTMNNTVSGAFENLTGTIETAGITVFEKFEKPLRKALLHTAGIINDFPGQFKALEAGGRNAATALTEAFGGVFGLKSNNMKLGGALEDMFKQVNWKGIGKTIGAGISGAVKLSGDFAKSTERGISAALSHVDGRKLLSGLLKVTAQAISALFSPSFWIKNFGNIFATVTIAIPIAKILKIPGAGALYNFISKPVLGALGTFGKFLISSLGKVAEDGATGFLAGLERLAPRTANLLLGVVTGSGKWLAGLPGVFKRAGSRAVSAIVGAIGGGVARVAEVAGSLAGRILSPLEKLASKAFDAGKSIIAAIGRGLRSLVPHFDISLNPLHPRFKVTFGGKAAGGIIAGSGDGDTEPRMLTPGEFVIRKAVVQKYGATFFAGLNGGWGTEGARGMSAGGIVQRANSIDAKAYPYVWGGGHSRTGVPDNGTGRDPGIGFDCSGAVSAILGVSPPRVSGGFTSWGSPGPGKPMDTKVFANATHVFAVLNGRGWGTSRENPGGGAGWLSYNFRPGFTIRHISDSDGATAGGAGNPREPSESGGQLRAQIGANMDRLEALRNKLGTIPTGKGHKAQRAAIQAQINSLVASNRTLRGSLRDAPTDADVKAAQEKRGSRIVNAVAAPFFRGKAGISALSRFSSGLASEIEGKDTEYGQAVRRNDQSTEDLGTPAGREKRKSEIGQLKILKLAQLKREEDEKKALEAEAAKLDGLIRKLRAKLKGKHAAHGPTAARIRKRIKDFDDRRLEKLAAARALGSQMEDTRLDIGDLDVASAEVDGTPDTDPASEPGYQSTTDKVSGALAHIDALERAGDLSPTDAQNARIGILNRAIAGDFGGLTDEETLSLRGDLRDATSALTQATVDNTQALTDLKKSIDDQLAFANGVSAVTSMQAVRAMSDVISGQLGTRVAARSAMPGSGSLNRL